MTHRVTDEDLVRYVDGELDADEASAVEAAAAADPRIAAAIRRLTEGAGLLRAAFNAPVHEAKTDPLAERVSAMLADAREETIRPAARRPTLRRWYIPATIAAGVAVVAIGIGGGYFVADSRISAERSALVAQRLEDRRAFDLAVQNALEKQVSGTAVRWSNPDTGNGGTVTPVRTFKSASGDWCREYAYESTIDGDKEQLRAIACRAPEGRWETRVPVFVES